MSITVTLALIGAAGTALDGARRLYNAWCNNDEASRLDALSKASYEEAIGLFETQKCNTTDFLNKLGKLKLEIWSNELAKFTSLFQSFKNVEFKNTNYTNGLTFELDNPENIKNIEIASLNATEILTGGATALATGALTGVAVYGGTMALATASTGTAIATLHGVAATNAALAYLGGGALAAGGGGMAAGACVLGGIVVGPVLLASGFMLESKSEENLALAKANFEKNRCELKKIEALINFMQNLENISNDFIQFLSEYRVRFSNVLKCLEDIVNEATGKSLTIRIFKQFGLANKLFKIDFNSLSSEQQKQLHIAAIMAQIMHGVMILPILHTNTNHGKEQSDINPEAQVKLNDYRKLIESKI